jgi:hypothetical protein
MMRVLTRKTFYAFLDRIYKKTRVLLKVSDFYFLDIFLKIKNASAQSLIRIPVHPVNLVENSYNKTEH